jgi:hypothetical protein
MARKKGGPDTVSGYFRALFEKHPDLLAYGASNAAIVEQWRKDHNGQDPSEKVMGNLANIKSLMRKKMGMVKRRRRRKGAVNGAVATTKVGRPRASVSALERLEGHIDACLSMAREQDSAGLDNAVKHLLAARRVVSWQMGEPK